jgi:hypothetical protein
LALTESTRDRIGSDRIGKRETALRRIALLQVSGYPDRRISARRLVCVTVEGFDRVDDDAGEAPVGRAFASAPRPRVQCC